MKLKPGDARVLASQINDALRMKFNIADPANAVNPGGRASDQNVVEVVLDEIERFFA